MSFTFNRMIEKRQYLNDFGDYLLLKMIVSFISAQFPLFYE